MNIVEIINKILSITVSDIIFWILNISTILFIAEGSGLLPKRISNLVNRNKTGQTIQVLKEMGINVEQYKRAMIASNIPSFRSSKQLEESVIRDLKKITIEGDVAVGRINCLPCKSYIDVMGCTTREEGATLFARHLSTFWKKTVDNNAAENSDINFIVTPKIGSPLLSYEFSKLISKPLALHVSEEKFKSEQKSFNQKFDFCGVIPEKGAIALIVDDSATGGRKIVDAVNDLRANNYIVTDCLLLFEPTIKNVRQVLNDHGVRVHSIIKLNEDGELYI